VSLVSPNDSVWFCMFEWTNSENAAARVEVDICWTEANGNTFSFYDARLENGLYVTIGLRQKKNGTQKASMSVLHDPRNAQVHEVFSKLLSQKPLPCKGFSPFRGSENDVYYIGNFPFRFGDWYRLIIAANEDRIGGYIHTWCDKKITKIGTFLTGKGSLIKARKGQEHTNGIALEHYGMIDACKYKSSILIRNPLRTDVNGLRVGAAMGRVDYQKCSNVNVDRNSEGCIMLSHGGDTTKRRQSGWIQWKGEVPWSLDVPLYECEYNNKWEAWKDV